MSYWIMNIPKDDFKRRMRDGSVVEDINKARELIVEYGNEAQETKWLYQHISELTNAMNIVNGDENKEAESKFLRKNFDLYYDEDQSGMVEPAVSEV